MQESERLQRRLPSAHGDYMFSKRLDMMWTDKSRRSCSHHGTTSQVRHTRAHLIITTIKFIKLGIHVDMASLSNSLSPCVGPYQYLRQYLLVSPLQ